MILQGVEVTIIGTLVSAPESFRHVRDVLRPDMFPSEEGRTLAAKVWEAMKAGKFNRNLLAANLRPHEAANIEAAMKVADAENLRTAAELLAGNWAQGRYEQALEDVARNFRAYEDWREADNVLSTAKREILQISAGKVHTPGEVVEAVIQDLMDGLLGNKMYSGISTGLPDLDDLTGGWQPGQQIVVGGRPGMGKTRWAVQQCYEAAKADHPAVFFSLEIGKEMIYRYLLSLMTGTTVQAMKTYNLPGKEEADELAAAGRILAKMPLYVVDDVFTLEDIVFTAQELSEQHGIKLFVVDYLQLIGKNTGRRTDNRNNELSDISRALKQLARRTDSVTMLLSQLSRKVEERQGRRPMIADLRDSGAIEADADVVVFPFHPSYYDKETEAPDEIIIAKQRDGEVGSVLVEWKNPGFYYPASEGTKADVFPEFTPSLNGKAVTMGDEPIPF